MKSTMDLRAVEGLVDTSENGLRLGKLFLETAQELRLLKLQIDNGQDPDGTAATHVGAFCLMLEMAGLEPLMREEFDAMRNCEPIRQVRNCRPPL